MYWISTSHIRTPPLLLTSGEIVYEVLLAIPNSISTIIFFHAFGNIQSYRVTTVLQILFCIVQTCFPKGSVRARLIGMHTEHCSGQPAFSLGSVDYKALPLKLYAKLLKQTIQPPEELQHTTYVIYIFIEMQLDSNLTTLQCLGSNPEGLLCSPGLKSCLTLLSAHSVVALCFVRL